MKRTILTLAALVLAGAVTLAGEPTKLSPETYRKINAKVAEIKANRRKAKALLPGLKKLVDAHRKELLGALSGGSALERALAAKILHLSSGEKDKVAAALAAAVKDEDLEVRRAAAAGLARMKVPSSAEAFIEALADVDETVRAVAAGALGTLKAKKAKDALVKVLEDENWKVRLAAVRSLAAIADKDTTEEIAGKLKPLLEDENAYVRMATAAIVQKLSGVKPETGGRPKKGGENVLHELSKEMGKVKDDLEAEHHGVEIQTAEVEITKKLDKLIEMIKKQQQQSSSKGKGKGKGKKKGKKKGGSKPGNEGKSKSGKGKKGGQNPSSPMSGEFMTSGDVRHGEKADISGVGADWGKLPAKVREELLQARQADLPDRYRRMLQLYLMGIAEEGGL